MKDINADWKSLSLMHEKMQTIKEACRFINTKSSSIKKKLFQLSEYTVNPSKFLMNIQPNITPCPSSKTTAPIFITARFRSGSTFLWNFFSNLPGFTAFYEPLQENLLQHLARKTPAQASHIGVHSYWEEYNHIAPDLAKLHHKEFGFRKLLLEEDDYYDELKQYISFLTQSTGDAIPVLQFNRVDFRLPWLKKNFPDVRIVHLYRNPRDQWYSMVKTHIYQDVTDADINTNYDLLLWGVYLAGYFPFLMDSITSSYERHYYIWKLSELMGKRCADISINFDNEILLSPERALNKMKKLMDIEEYQNIFLENIASVQKGQWRSVRPQEWFDEIEKRCDKKLNDLGLMDFFATRPLSVIITDFSKAWGKIFPVPPDTLLKKTIAELIKNRGESAQSIAGINDDLNKIVASSNEVAENSQKIVNEYVKKAKRF